MSLMVISLLFTVIVSIIVQPPFPFAIHAQHQLGCPDLPFQLLPILQQPDDLRQDKGGCNYC
jgi:hypothetical protein